MNELLRKKILLILGFLAVVALTTLTGHQGDLDYFINTDDGSFRNGLISAVILPLTFISSSPIFIILSWAIIVTLSLYLVLDKFNLHYFMYVAMFSPFLLFPSKDSLVLLLFTISIVCGQRYKFIYLVLCSAIMLIRPYYALITVYIAARRLFPKFNISIYVVSLVLVLFVVAGVLGYEQFNEIMNSFLSYTVGYFYAAEEAGTTDWNFLNSMSISEFNYYIIVEFLVRALFPLWMVKLDGVSSKIYFLMYVYLICYSMSIVIKNNKIMRSAKRNTFASVVLLLSILPAMPILITNAGSSVRYLCTLPLLMYMLNMTTSIKFQTDIKL